MTSPSDVTALHRTSVFGAQADGCSCRDEVSERHQLHHKMALTSTLRVIAKFGLDDAIYINKYRRTLTIGTRIKGISPEVETSLKSRLNPIYSLSKFVPKIGTH